MNEHLLLEPGDIIRHKEHPRGPEWRIDFIYRYPNGTAMYDMRSTGSELWGVAYLDHELYGPLTRSESICMLDIESWAMKRIHLE